MDIDIGIKLHKINRKIGIIKNVFIYQHFGHSTMKRVLGKRVYLYGECGPKTYYYTRNNFYLRKKYGAKIWRKTKVSLFIKPFIKLMLFEKQKGKAMRLMARGMIDAARGMMGKR